jgi:rhamnosyl/mannosyltransferase
LIVWHHSDLLRPSWAPLTYGRLQRRLYRRADCVIVSSPRLAEHSSLVQQARRVEVVPFGIPIPVSTDVAQLQVGVQKIRARAAGPIVLFVGRFVYYKGIDVLIDAMAGCPGTLVLIGEGPLEGDLRQQVADRGLSARVSFAGNVPSDELRAYYAAADVFVLPSTACTEAFGVVQVEAMAAGVPVISTDLPTGVPWVNQHEKTGLVVRPGDVEAMRTAIRRVLLDPALRSVMGTNAAERARTMFDRQHMIERFKAIVESVVERSAIAGLAPSGRAAAPGELGRAKIS